MSRVDLRRFVAWGATFALITAGAVNPLLAAPLWIPALFGLTYLARGPNRWPALLGAPAGVGAAAAVLGAAASPFAELRALGLSLLAGGSLVAVGAFLAFRGKASARDRASDSPVGAQPRRRLRPAPHTLRRFPLGFALGVFLVAFSYFWVYGNDSEYSSQGESACMEIFRGEGQSVAEEPGLWPPGGRCAYRAGDGTVTIRSRPVPWLELLLVPIVALGAAAGTFAYFRLLLRAELD